jgi:hypothetical protein
VTVDLPQKVAADRAQVRHLARNDRLHPVGEEVPPSYDVVAALRGAKDAGDPNPLDPDSSGPIGTQFPVEQLSDGDNVHRPECLIPP